MSRLRWPDSTNSVSEKPGTIQPSLEETMTMSRMWFLIGAIMLVALAAFPIFSQEEGEMSFFITSMGPGDGANLGGLDGADGHCAMLAQAAGAGGKTWHAYLSTSGAGGVNAPATASGRAPGTTPRGCRWPPTSRSCTSRTSV